MTYSPKKYEHKLWIAEWQPFIRSQVYTAFSGKVSCPLSAWSRLCEMPMLQGCNCWPSMWNLENSEQSMTLVNQHYCSIGPFNPSDFYQAFPYFMLISWLKLTPRDPPGGGGLIGVGALIRENTVVTGISSWGPDVSSVILALSVFIPDSSLCQISAFAASSVQYDTDLISVEYRIWGNITHIIPRAILNGGKTKFVVEKYESVSREVISHLVWFAPGFQEFPSLEPHQVQMQVEPCWI